MTKDAQPHDSEQVMTPLWVESPYSRGDVGEIIRRQAARPESWRDTWPDAPQIIRARDILTAHFRRENHFKADSFLPDDAMKAIIVAADRDEFHDMVVFVMSIEEALDVKIDDELAHKMTKSLTYLEFIKLLLPQLSPEHLLRPLVLPIYYYRSGRWSSFKRWLSGGFLHSDLGPVTK